MTVLRICRFFFFTWVYAWVRFVRIWAFAGCCCYVHYAACKNIGFFHNVFCCEVFAFTRSNGFNGPFVAGEFIHNLYICQCQVAIIRCCDLVCDRFAKGISFSVCRSTCCILADCQMTVLRICRFFFFTWNYSRRSLWIRTRCCSGCFIDYTACKYIVFCHNIRCCEFFVFTWCKAFNVPFITCQFISYYNICQCQISVIFCGNLVSNCFSKGISFTVSRFACCVFCDCQMALRIFKLIYGICIFKVFVAIKACCYFVCKCSCQKICFSNYIFCSC